jgi:transposase
MNNKFNLRQFRAKYGTHEQCLEAIKQARFSELHVCPKCQTEQRFYPVKGRTAYACNSCGHHIFPLAGTIFEKSSTPLDLWFFAIYLMTQTRSGTSAKQLERMLGVTYKTAWRMFKQIRMIMANTNGSLFSGVVEVDESFFGGKGHNRRYIPDFNSKPKNIIMGMVEREGKVVMKKIETTGRLELMEQIEKHIDRTATVMHDQYPGYQNLHRLGYDHHAVNHGKTYVRGKVYTNNVEGLWGRIKPAVTGVYRKVSSKYIESYMNEYCFRYNYRKTPEIMFDILLGQITSVRS